MDKVEKLDEGGIYGAMEGLKGIEYRIIERIRSKEERKRLREGIGTEIMMKR